MEQKERIQVQIIYKTKVITFPLEQCNSAFQPTS